MWPLLADLVCPALGAAAIVVAWLRRDRVRAVRYAAGLSAALAWVVLLAAAERRLGWWRAAGIDFSTHTGVAVALATGVAAVERGAWIPLAALLAGYAWLMARLGYHSPRDILATAAVTAPVAWLGVRGCGGVEGTPPPAGDTP